MTVVEEPPSALRARDLDDAFQTVDEEGLSFPGGAPPSDDGHRAQQQQQQQPALELSNDSEAFRGREIKVWVPRTPLSAETSYVHDFPEHPLEMRCVKKRPRGWWWEEGFGGVGDFRRAIPIPVPFLDFHPFAFFSFFWVVNVDSSHTTTQPSLVSHTLPSLPLAQVSTTRQGV